MDWAHGTRTGRRCGTESRSEKGEKLEHPTDPGERRHLAAENPPIAAGLSALLDKFRSQGFSRPMRGKGAGFLS